MKPVHINDVLAAVSYLTSVPVTAREHALNGLLQDVDFADEYTRSHNSAHPVFGDGSLIAAALRHGRRGPTSFQTDDSLSVWIDVLTSLRQRCVTQTRN